MDTTMLLDYLSMLMMHPSSSCRLASNVRVNADSPVLEKPVEKGFHDDYKNKKIKK